jgi:hypothetical protein
MQAVKKGNVSSEIPASTWEFMDLSQDVLKGAMFRIYGIEKTTLGRMCINPAVHDDARRNPIDRVALHFEKMVAAGYADEVAAQISALAALVGLELCDPDEACKPEGKPLQDELLDIHPAIVEHGQAIRRGDSVQAVEAWERKAIHEIKQATNAYREDAE